MQSRTESSLLHIELGVQTFIHLNKILFDTESKRHVPMKLLIFQYLLQGEFAYLRRANYNPSVSVRPSDDMYNTRELLNDICLWVIVQEASTHFTFS